jgi:hypothetical protein
MPDDTNDMDMNDSSLPEIGLAPIKPQQVAVVGAEEKQCAPVVTAAQARIEAVADCLKVAYANASSLKLTPEESNALAEDFPDEAFSLGAGGDPNLIYIEHAYLRQRLNKVLGVGAAVPIRRREWAEDFSYFSSGKTVTGTRIYADMCIVVRGCLVGEAVGAGTYYKNNAKATYDDALESAMSNAFRRCCKQFGVGLQAWMKGWGEGWKRRHSAPASAPAPTPIRAARPAPAPAAVQQQAPIEVEVVKPEPTPAKAEAPKKATQATRDWFIKLLGPAQNAALEYFVKTCRLLPTESLEDLPLEHVPVTKEAAYDLMKGIQAFADGERLDDNGNEAPVKPVEGTEIVGFVRWLGEKPTKNGKAKYSILISESNEKGVQSENDAFLTTFSKTEYEKATELKHRHVVARYTESKYGKDLVEGTLGVSEVLP